MCVNNVIIYFYNNKKYIAKKIYNSYHKNIQTLSFSIFNLEQEKYACIRANVIIVPLQKQIL